MRIAARQQRHDMPPIRGHHQLSAISLGILQEYAAGAKVAELCRKHGMSDATLYKWKAKYGGMTVSDLRRLKDLEVENAELKRLLADAMLDNSGLKGLLAKNS